MAIFPSLKNRPLYLAGESYAGTYIVCFQCFLNYYGLSDLDASAVHFKDALQHGQSAREASENRDWRRR